MSNPYRRYITELECGHAHLFNDLPPKLDEYLYCYRCDSVAQVWISATLTGPSKRHSVLDLHRWSGDTARHERIGIMPYNIQQATPEDLTSERASKYADHELVPVLRQTHHDHSTVKVECTDEDERDRLVREVKGVAKALNIGHRVKVTGLTVVFAGRDKKAYTLSEEGLERRNAAISESAAKRRKTAKSR